MEIIEGMDGWRERYVEWWREHRELLVSDEVGDEYPFVTNEHAPFVPMRRALSLVNLALITSAEREGVRSRVRTACGSGRVLNARYRRRF